MSNRLWVLGTVLVSIAIVVLGWFLGISPRLTEASLATTERQSVEAQNQAQEAVIALLKQQFDDIEELEEELEELQMSIPGAADTDEVFDQIVAAASAAGVALKNITALEGAFYGGSVDPAAATDPDLVQPAEPGAEGTPAVAPLLDGSLSGRFFTVGVSIKVEGSADQVFSLVSALQNGDRLFLITDVDFATDGVPAAAITGFVYVVTGASAAPPE